MSVHDIQGFDAAANAEELLIDVAGKIQLSPTKHDQAVQHYEALCKHVDRPGSPLEGKVVICYPSGSFGIGAVIASRVKTQQHDVDVVMELDLPASTLPAIVLGLVYNAIRGDEGSLYYDKTTLNSRCVTVRYDDGVTVDLMPIIRDQSGQERSGKLFHSKRGESYTKPVNPFGFKTLYNETVQEDPNFVKAFRDHNGVLVEKAAVEPMDDHVRLEEKSPRTVAIQLLKRFRDRRYRRDDREGHRSPPSVILAAYGLNKPNAQPSLLAELADLVDVVRRDLEAKCAQGQLVDIRNPAYPPDVFSDRWPEDLEAQRLFKNDLAYLADRLQALAREVFSPLHTKAILQDLFGETAAEHAIKSFMDHRAQDAERGRMKFGASGVLLTTAAAATSSRVAARASTDYGGDAP